MRSFHEALSHLDRNAEQHHISVELEDDLLMADMDARLIVQVVINLVNNAIKYTPAGSHISLSAVRAGPFVQVEVSDDGPGIADSAKQKIFDMFYTADNSRGDGRRGWAWGCPCAGPSSPLTAVRYQFRIISPTGQYFVSP